jgi:putative phosphoribosyl transferase
MIDLSEYGDMRFAIDTDNSIFIPSGKIHLNGFLHIPKQAIGLILFVHGSGSSRFSARNQHVARMLNQSSFATLLFDLFTAEEDAIDSKTAELRFDMNFLASRLGDATQWCMKQLAEYQFSLGYFGASTGGGAALIAAAQEPSNVRAVVSRGGRPDLAKEFIASVKVPTLLIVGGNDAAVIKMNEEALSQMNCIKELTIVPGATHLFEEPGTLDQVANLSKEWFVKHL